MGDGSLKMESEIELSMINKKMNEFFSLGKTQQDQQSHLKIILEDLEVKISEESNHTPQFKNQNNSNSEKQQKDLPETKIKPQTNQNKEEKIKQNSEAKISPKQGLKFIQIIKDKLLSQNKILQKPPNQKENKDQNNNSSNNSINKQKDQIVIEFEQNAKPNNSSLQKSETSNYQVVYENQVNKTQIYFNVHLIKCEINSVERVMVIMDDITTNFQLIQLINQDKIKDNVMAIVSHDLKSPLNCFIQVLNIYQNTKDIQFLDEHIQMLQSTAQIMKQQINDIQDMSLLKNNKFKLFITQFDLKESLKQIVQIGQHLIDNKKIMIKLSYESKHEFIENDEIRIRQIVINLLTNAIRFTDQGIIKISAKDNLFDQTIIISVSDTGKGIKKELQQILFQPFSSFSSSYGVGLGLMISKNLAQYVGNQSEINLESEEGKGSEFSFNVKINANEQIDIILKDLKGEKSLGRMFRTNNSQEYGRATQQEMSLQITNNSRKNIQNSMKKSDQLQENLIISQNQGNQLPQNQYLVQSQQNRSQILLQQSINKIDIINESKMEQSAGSATFQENSDRREPIESKKVNTMQEIKKLEEKFQKDGGEQIRQYLRQVSGKKKINFLIVDDQQFNLQILEKQIQITFENNSKYKETATEIYRARNLEETQQILSEIKLKSQENIDILISDYFLGYQNGIQLINQVNQNQQNEIFSVLISSDQIILQGNQNEIVNLFIQKPINKQKLQYIVNKYIEFQNQQ